MLILVLGSSGSGKSAFAENIATSLSKELLYVATMQPFGNEAEQRIKRHREMRKNKGFISVDCYADLEHFQLEKKYGVVLLECMSNLLANEMYRENANREDLIHKIISGIEKIKAQTDHFIIVSNDVGCDLNDYSEETLSYINKLGIINQELVKKADTVVEVVCSIPIYHKGEKLW
ncbi:bifunctional adenosylcobinamide kinase/adenosylcobinamide-phosphate guanylyltransferase [Paludicola sp. MB14-C6]|uniref:bifunctional adenosylcobinamide kinase/adenosylcobinamide-phosphate guanylyltransferase n=1 Tax=Paludihabitans sp. MB14-C6 TaxID=3070656 RepID=UPI0027DD4C9B|nr:bifunctional adenosylcobinamide kinase/adenosylcobinamide-phosphate guanylyltransferase [Paludicola sp. MB14-C6]WMJ22045.1 bifunctional adenosylcobinamide kinase/adenosylcobinamide-phosphate guanylyltransferase [Paludicola sp. MB14-C6]